MNPRKDGGGRSAGRFWFIGVRTLGSSAFAAFPGWMRALEQEGELIGVDVPMNAPDETYRRLIEQLRDDPDAEGAVITAHKARLFEATAADLDGVDDLARTCREISILRRDSDRLFGAAIDPLSVGRALAAMLPPHHWRHSGGHLMIYGTGGTAAALLVHLYAPTTAATDAPSTVHLIDIQPERAMLLRDSMATWRPETTVQTPNPEEATNALAALPAGSLIINATGLGKDRPGSPIPLPAPWPHNTVIWDLNYRGDLPFLADARAAAPDRSLQVHDGWRLFLHGWAEALSALLDQPITGDRFDAFEQAALAARH